MMAVMLTLLTLALLIFAVVTGILAVKYIVPDAVEAFREGNTTTGLCFYGLAACVLLGDLVVLCGCVDLVQEALK